MWRGLSRVAVSVKRLSPTLAGLGRHRKSARLHTLSNTATQATELEERNKALPPIPHTHTPHGPDMPCHAEEKARVRWRRRG